MMDTPQDCPATRSWDEETADFDRDADMDALHSAANAVHFLVRKADAAINELLGRLAAKDIAIEECVKATELVVERAENAEAALARMQPQWPDVMNLRVTKQMADQWWTRDGNCNRLSIDFGEPDDVGFHTPTITTHYDDNPLKQAEAALADARGERDAYMKSYTECVEARNNAEAALTEAQEQAKLAHAAYEEAGQMIADLKAALAQARAEVEHWKEEARQYCQNAAYWRERLADYERPAPPAEEAHDG